MDEWWRETGKRGDGARRATSSPPPATAAPAPGAPTPAPTPPSATRALSISLWGPPGQMNPWPHGQQVAPAPWAMSAYEPGSQVLKHASAEEAPVALVAVEKPSGHLGGRGGGGCEEKAMERKLERKGEACARTRPLLTPQAAAGMGCSVNARARAGVHRVSRAARATDRRSLMVVVGEATPSQPASPPPHPHSPASFYPACRPGNSYRPRTGCRATWAWPGSSPAGRGRPWRWRPRLLLSVDGRREKTGRGKRRKKRGG